jgi:hypothetical protein|tara:strand:- start:430 stop:702 length:273 start_codon:yes stop_codon:yes gene_type:complete
MLAEGMFILTVSLSGNYDDLQFVGYFNDCPSAMVYYEEHCNQYKAASCLLKEYSLLSKNHVEPSPFDFDTIKEAQSCGFVGLQNKDVFLD